ncbi:hypothetical protein LRS04_01250 [Phenylobacterium sp. J367]|nr:hypothetical protein [Phenylobacterium sp. J367]MCR5877150.1 hypothetical protein [Phenylobacterium sp. J367]
MLLEAHQQVAVRQLGDAFGIIFLLAAGVEVGPVPVLQGGEPGVGDPGQAARGVQDDAGGKQVGLVAGGDEPAVGPDLQVGKAVQAGGLRRGQVQAAGVGETADRDLRRIRRVERDGRAVDGDRRGIGQGAGGRDASGLTQPARASANSGPVSFLKPPISGLP